MASLRLQGPRLAPSGSAQTFRDRLLNLGIQVDAVIAGRPDIRGHTGFVFRWGCGWFSEMRDSGPGWDFERNDKAGIGLRADFILQLFRQRSSLAQLAIANGHLAIMDSS